MAQNWIMRMGTVAQLCFCYFFCHGPFPLLENPRSASHSSFGSNAAWLLLSFITVQTYTYYMMSTKDHPIFKTLVYSTVFVAFTQSAFEGYLSYRYLVSVWGVLETHGPGFVFIILMGSILSLSTEGA